MCWYRMICQVIDTTTEFGYGSSFLRIICCNDGITQLLNAVRGWCIHVVVTWTNVVVDVKCLWSLFAMDEPRDLSICCCPRGICVVRSSMFRYCSGYDCLSYVIPTSLCCGLLGLRDTLSHVVMSLHRGWCVRVFIVVEFEVAWNSCVQLCQQRQIPFGSTISPTGTWRYVFLAHGTIL